MITIDYKDRRSIYEQLVERVTMLAATGIFPSGSQLPSVRQLASELSINPNTIQRAYAELEKAGVTYSVKGRGSFITDDVELLRSKRHDELMTAFNNLAARALAAGVPAQKLIAAIANFDKEGEAK